MDKIKKEAAFTIVELLIVIVIIAILAAITVVSYRGIQQRARDTQRKQDVAVIVKALEMYYIDEGRFPPSGGAGTGVGLNASWSSTANPTSWETLGAYLVPKYISKMPSEPIQSSSTGRALGENYSYDYFTNLSGSDYCGVGDGQMYILTYRVEQTPNNNTSVGDCSTRPVGFYANVSNYRVVK